MVVGKIVVGTADVGETLVGILLVELLAILLSIHCDLDPFFYLFFYCFYEYNGSISHTVSLNIAAIPNPKNGMNNMH